MITFHYKGWTLFKKIIPFVVMLCAIVFVLLSVRIFDVSGGSMEPNFHQGQRVVVDALTWHITGLHVGDVIVFTNPHDTKVIDIKRIAALPGGQGEILDHTVSLGPEDYYVLGDNRSKSTDSREFGAVQPINIIGRVVLPL